MGAAGAGGDDQTLYTWGDNTSGVLGLGDTTDRSSPVQVGSDTDWSFARGSKQASIGVKTTGSLWTWGRSAFGESGRDIANGIQASIPVQVGTDTHWGTKLIGSRVTIMAVTG